MIGVAKAMVTTMRTMLRKPVTVQYPTVRRRIPESNRGSPVLLWDFEADEPFCTGCHACERACPSECITVVMKDNPRFAEEKSKRRKIVDQFWLDYGRCMHCAGCVEACNFDAIAMNNTWAAVEHACLDRSELVQDLEQLLAQSKAGKITPWVAS